MGIVYVLTNDAMPGIIKIGRTDRNDVQDRVAELNRSSAAPLPFVVHYAGEVADSSSVESILHELFSSERRNPRREFFWMQPERVVTAMSLARPKDVTPGREQYLDAQSQEELVSVERRRPPFRFSMVRIPVGATLSFSRKPEIQATVVDDRMVEFDGERMSLSPAAVKAFGLIGISLQYGPQGPAYWTYEGRLLTEIRDAIENDAEPLLVP